MAGQAGQAAQRTVVVLLNTESMDLGLVKAWEQARLSDGLCRFGEVLCWGLGNSESMFPGVSSMRQLHAMDVDLLIWIDAAQVFLDVEVIARGISTTDFSVVDHLTQWAHCRIPLGVGARVTKRSILDQMDVDNPKALLEQLDSTPCGVRIRYDPQGWTNFEQSRLDTRWSSTMAESMRHQPPKPGEWTAGYNGLLRLPKKNDPNMHSTRFGCVARG